LGLAGLLGPVGMIGGAALSTGSTLVGEAASLGARAAAPAAPDLGHVSVLTVTYREDKVVRITRQSLAGMAAG
jgi:hypothetical protein